MIQKQCTYFSIITLLGISALHAHSSVSPTLVFRSQGFHADRQRDVGMTNHTNLYEMNASSDDDPRYWTFDVGAGFSRSFRSKRLAQCLFGDDIVNTNQSGNSIYVQGSGVSNRNERAWLADYLYLNCDYDGSFRIKPQIQNVLIDLDYYLGLDEVFQGLYYRIYAPITWTKWETEFCVSDPATVLTTSCSTGYFTPTGSEVLLDSLADYFKGQAPDRAGGVTFNGLHWAKMPACKQTRWGVAELRTELGWNLVQNDGYHFGTAVHLAIPTGNKRRAEYVMQPVIGNGNHYEIGTAVHGHYIFWRDLQEERHAGFYFDAVLTHLFEAREERTFDLCNKPNSRYMLAAQFTPFILHESRGLGGVTANGITGTITRATAQFNNKYAPVANLTTTDLDVRIGVQADIVAMFNYTKRGFSWDIGYNFWARSCESFDCPAANNTCSSDNLFDPTNAYRWGLKGDARMFGFAGEADASVPIAADDAVPLSATQSDATIHAGTNASTVNGTLDSVTLQNGGVDDSQFAITGDGPIRVIHTPLAEGGLNLDSNQIKTSLQPVLLTATDVDLHQTKGLSHTLFSHMSYTWDRDTYHPYLGGGFSAEFGKTSTPCTNSSALFNCSTSSCSQCNSCSYCTLSQWSIWIKGGLSFN